MIERTHRFTVQEYMSLVIDSRTELIEGVIYDVSPRNDRHRYALAQLAYRLQAELAHSYFVQQQDAVFLDGWDGTNAPEPDIAVVIASAVAHPTAQTTLAVIEVSDSTVKHDRYKVQLYRNARIPSWIVNIALQVVEEYPLDQPDQMTTYRLGEKFDILGVKINVTSLFEVQG